METNEIYREVVCDFFSESEKCWCVDAWTDPEQENNGCVVARIDGESGNVYYMDDAAKDSPLAQEIIKQKQSEVRAERKQRRGEFGETMVLLTSEVWYRVYDKMREPDCTKLAVEIRDAAIEFETKWQQGDEDEKDVCYLDEIGNFADKLTERLIESYC